MKPKLIAAALACLALGGCYRGVNPNTAQRYLDLYRPYTIEGINARHRDAEVREYLIRGMRDFDDAVASAKGKLAQ